MIGAMMSYKRVMVGLAKMGRIAESQMAAVSPAASAGSEDAQALASLWRLFAENVTALEALTVAAQAATEDDPDVTAEVLLAGHHALAEEAEEAEEAAGVEHPGNDEEPKAEPRPSGDGGENGPNIY